MSRVLYAGVALSLTSIGLPWTLSGQVAPFEVVEFALGWLALGLLWWHPRAACLIGAVVWMSAVTDYGAQLVLGSRSLDHDPWLVAGIATWAASSSLLLIHSGEELQRAKRTADRR